MSKKRKEFSVPVQKGRINPNPQTSKMMTYPEKVEERRENMRITRRNQELELRIPKN